MQLFATFLFIFTLAFFCFIVSIAFECRINEQDASKVAYTITVDKSARGNFTTIQDAINAIPHGNDRWIGIYIYPGVYNEKVFIPVDKQCILLEGKSAESTTIVWNDHNATDSSATFTSQPDNFVAKGITFKNSYNHAPSDVNFPFIKQAVAARIYGDKSAFHGCRFLGLQDTLWDVKGRHYFNTCLIEGALDFIFGQAQSFHEDCWINVTATLLPTGMMPGYITAQGRGKADDPDGFVFERCKVVGSGQAYLGRAWGPFSRVIFHHSLLTEVVAPQGWDAWSYQGHEPNITYAESNCRGSGSDISKRVQWIKKIEGPKLQEFTRSSFIDQEGWLAKQP